jgi:hypothetical protein
LSGWRAEECGDRVGRKKKEVRSYIIIFIIPTISRINICLFIKKNINLQLTYK